MKGVVNYSTNDVLQKQQNKPLTPTITVPKKNILAVLPYLGLQSKIASKQIMSCINKFYEYIDLRVIFQRTRCTKSFFPYKDRLSRGQMAKIVYRAACWDCNDFYIGKTTRPLHDRKTEHFKALINGHYTSSLADHVTSTGHSLKWDHFEVLAKLKGDPTLTVK